MDIHTNIPLKQYLTMKLGGNARFLADAHTKEDVAALYKRAAEQQIPFVAIGGGSNLLASDAGFDGLVVRNRIRGVDILSDTASDTTIRFGAGESWDEAVAMTTERSLSGIEAMSAIPGTMGAAPVQNIGAYGQEIADVFVELEAYDTTMDQFVRLSFDDCKFSYRHSIFRGEAKGRYVIVSVTLKLFKTSPQPPFYQALQSYLDEHGITFYTPKVIREAVTAIRSDKLPDPNVRPNTGSFFKNAIVERWQREELLAEHSDMPSFELDGGKFKIPSGWLIEHAGLKGKLLHGMRVNEKNALVLINESAASYSDLDAARREIITIVRDTFRVTLEQEPLEL